MTTLLIFLLCWTLLALPLGIFFGSVIRFGGE
jgi:hypothetical protein